MDLTIIRILIDLIKTQNSNVLAILLVIMLYNTYRFTRYLYEEIKKRDETKVASYLEKVLSEIHQDPLRKRNNKEEENDSNLLKEITEKILDKIPSSH